MFPTSLSSHFAVRRLTEGDLAQILDLCRGNPLFYRYCPPSPSAESIREDMKSLPPGVEPENKFYLGLFDGDGLAAVLDLVLHYPEAGTAFIGFFMTGAARQGRGTGSAMVEEVCAALKREGFTRVMLAYADGNAQSEHFWQKNRFVPTGVEKEMAGFRAVQMVREL